MNPKWRLTKTVTGRTYEPATRQRVVGRDRRHLAWLRRQRCAFADFRPYQPCTPCQGPIEAHHPTGSGLALKAPDRDAIPLCRKHHRELHDGRGTFLGWDKARLKAWQTRTSRKYRAGERKRAA